MKSIVLNVFVFIIFSGFAYGGNKIEKVLKQGVNVVESSSLNTSVIFVRSVYDNNTSHPSNTLSVFVKHKNEWHITSTPDDDGFIWSDILLSASTVKIVGYKVLSYNGSLHIIKAVKNAGVNDNVDLSGKSKVDFKKFTLSRNDIEPGVPIYTWNTSGSYLSDKEYIDVDVALEDVELRKFK